MEKIEITKVIDYLEERIKYYEKLKSEYLERLDMAKVGMLNNIIKELKNNKNHFKELMDNAENQR